MEKLSNTQLKILSKWAPLEGDRTLAADLLETRKVLNETIDRQMENERLQAELDNAKAALSALQEATRWVPVGERLPELHQEGEGEYAIMESGTVLVNWLFNPMSEDRYIRDTAKAFIQDDKWVCLEDGDERFVTDEFAPTHWMPLPTPPEAGTK